MVVNIKKLHEAPYIRIPFPVKRQQIAQAVDSFLDFLDLPEAIKHHINLKISPQHRRGEIGFTHRDPEDDVYRDSKDFFHYHPIIERHYRDFIAQHATVEVFLKNASALWQTAYDAAQSILSRFEADYPGTLSKIFQADAPHIVLRFLRYDAPTSGRYLAKPHFDAGSFTIAIAESAPGLRIGTNPQDLELVEHAEDSAIFMVSSNFRKIIDSTALKPAWHDVIQIKDADIGKPFSRWAVVVFIDGHSVDSLPRSETHKFFDLAEDNTEAAPLSRRAS